MIRKTLLAIFIFGLLVQVAFSTVTITYPADQELLEDETIQLGDIAPGQTLKLVFSRDSGRIFFWNIIELDIPSDWEIVHVYCSDIGAYCPTMDAESITLYVKIPETALDGEYTFDITAMNSEDQALRATEYRTVSLTVKEDIYDYNVITTYYVNAGEKTNVSYLVKSNSIADDVLTFGEVEGFPRAWVQQETIGVGALEQKSVTISVEPLQEGLYEFSFEVTRESSSIKDTTRNYLRVVPTVVSKLMSFSEGFSLVPILQPFYSLLSWFGIQ